MAVWGWGAHERPDADTVRMMAAMRTMRWWERASPRGRWMFVPAPGFGEHGTWGVQVPLLVTMPDTVHIEEPDEVRLARRFLAHIGRSPAS